MFTVTNVPGAGADVSSAGAASQAGVYCSQVHHCLKTDLRVFR